MILSPFAREVSLAGRPSQSPTFATTVQSSSSEEREVTLSDPQAIRALLLMMNYYAVSNGAACHWGGPSAMAEINSALHAILFAKVKEEWHQRFHFVNDAGHTENGLYALKANYRFGGLTFEDLWQFRSIKSPLTGHGEAHVYPEGVFISNGPLGSSLPVAQGLAMADTLAGNKRITICLLSDGATMEGEVKEALSAISGLSRKGKINPFLVILSNNNTKLSGRISEDSFDMQDEYRSLQHNHWDYRLLEDGHDLQKVYTTLEKALNDLSGVNPRPIFLDIHTIKGFGLKETEKSKSGGHGFPLKKGEGAKLSAYIQELFPEGIPTQIKAMLEDAIAYQPKIPLNRTPTSSSEKKEKVQVGVSRAMIEMAERHFPIVSISADLQGSTGVSGFQAKFPKQSFDIGVAESNMLSSATGLSKLGYIPVVDTFAQFGITKGNLPLIMGQLSLAPTIAIFSHTGFQDAADGASHQATTYLAATASIPGVEVISCSCSEQMYQYLKTTLQEFRTFGKSTLFFIGREDYPSHYGHTDFAWKKAITLRSVPNSLAVIVATGPMVQEALIAHETLKLQGIATTIIESPFINHPDLETINEQLERSQGRLITLEDHQITGGMGQILTHQLLQMKNPALKEVKSLGIRQQFGRSAYQAADLYAMHKMDSYAVVQAVQSFTCQKN